MAKMAMAGPRGASGLVVNPACVKPKGAGMSGAKASYLGQNKGKTSAAKGSLRAVGMVTRGK